MSHQNIFSTKTQRKRLIKKCYQTNHTFLSYNADVSLSIDL
jgi:hypothetical protein